MADPFAHTPGLVAVRRSVLPGSASRVGPPGAHVPPATAPSATASVAGAPPRPTRTTHAACPSLAKYASTARGAARPSRSPPNVVA
jgi:hypothetical protein